MEELYEDLLRLPNLSVNRVESEDKLIRIYCEIAEDSICPVCQVKNTSVNQSYERVVRDLDISGRKVYLHLKVRQYKCATCGRTHSQQFDFVSKGKSHTKRQSKWIFEMCKKQSHTEVGSLLDINSKTVENVFYEQAEAQVRQVDWSTIRRIGIDEFSFKKGHKDFILVLVDLDTHAIIGLLPFRDKASIVSYFKGLGECFCNQVEVYSSDMWQPFLDIAQELFVNADAVIDRFHWTKHLNKVIDNLRKDLRKEDKENGAFKNLKWTLIKRSEKLNEKEKEQLEEAIRASKSFEDRVPLEKVYQIKNELIAIFDKPFSFEMGKLEVEFWIKKAEIIDNKHLNKFIKLLRKNLINIVNYFKDRVSNGVVEGTNNLLRTVKRFTFNMTNFEHFRARVFAWKT
jgi:transposase